MTRDIPSQLAAYGAQLNDGAPPVTVEYRQLEPETLVDAEETLARQGWPGMRVAAAFAIVLLIGLTQVIFRTGDADDVSSAGIGQEPDLGVFEPLRGWIVYPVSGWHLEAVDPDDPTSRYVLDVPKEASRGVPIGWSADGSRLALEDEDGGHEFVIDRNGEISARVTTGGCCMFVHSNAMAPDGGLSPGLVWSPDGSAYAVVREAGEGVSILVVEAATGTAGRPDGQEFAGFALIRHVAWSPNGRHLVVTGSETSPISAAGEPLADYNPAALPLPANLYVLDVDGEGRRTEVASGYFMAAAWSPDGKRIAALEWPDRKHARRIVVMDSDGADLRVLPGVTPRGDFTGITWHPVP